MEKHYAFIKDGRVANVAVFAEENEELATSVMNDFDCDKFVWVGETPPAKYSSYDGVTFAPPTNEYLISIGVMAPPVVEEETE